MRFSVGTSASAAAGLVAQGEIRSGGALQLHTLPAECWLRVQLPELAAWAAGEGPAAAAAAEGWSSAYRLQLGASKRGGGEAGEEAGVRRGGE